MQEPLSAQTQQALNLLEGLRDEDALDPKVRAMRGLFDHLAYYAIQFVGLLVLAIALVKLGEPVAKHLGLSFKAAGIALLIVLLGAAIAFRMSLDGKEGEKRERWLRRQGRTYMPVIAVALAFYAGLYWRDHNPPDRSRAQAETAAWRACGQLPICIQLANRFNGGDDVGQYIRRLAPK